MPTRAPTHKHGLSRTTEQRRAESDAKRPTSTQRGYGVRHRRWRLMVLARCPVCARCGEPATVADHIVPLSAGGTNALENGQGLCVTCHNRKSAREDGGGWSSRGRGANSSAP